MSAGTHTGMGGTPEFLAPSDLTAAYGADAVARVDSLFRVGGTVRAEDVFGPSTALISVDPVPASDRALWQQPPFQGALFVLAVAWMVLLYRGSREVAALLRPLSFERAHLTRLRELSGGSATRLLWALVLLGWPLTALLLVRFSPPVDLPSWQLYGIAAALPLALALWQVVMLRMVGAAALATSVTRPLLALKFNLAGIGVLVLAPVELLCLACTGTAFTVTLWMGAGMAALIALLYIEESLALFLSEKIPILHWILYLCTIEVLPVSFLWVCMSR